MGGGVIGISVNRMHYILQEIDLKSWIQILITLYRAYNLTFAKYLLSYDKKRPNLLEVNIVVTIVITLVASSLLLRETFGGVLPRFKRCGTSKFSIPSVKIKFDYHAS